MKALMTAATLVLLPALSSAQTCKSASPEMIHFESQKSWKSYTVQDPLVPGSIQGLIDEKGGFHFQQLSRAGEYPVKLEVNPANKSYKDFFAYCSKDSTRSEYLHSMRRSGENNQYTVRLRYLPAINGFTNDPWKDQHFQWSDVRLRLTLRPDASSVAAEFRPEAYEAKLREMLLTQLKNQKEIGVLTLDLTGLDDFACDLTQGKATLGVFTQAISNTPLVSQTKVVEPSDVATIYQALKAQNFGSGGTESREQTLFTAGRVISRLQEQRQISPYEDKKSFELFKGLMNPTLSEPAPLSMDDLACVAASFQTYEIGLLPHTFEIKFGFSPLQGPL